MRRLQYATYTHYCISKHRTLRCKASHVYLVLFLTKNVADGFNMFRADTTAAPDDGCASSHPSLNVFNIAGGGYIVTYFGK